MIEFGMILTNIGNWFLMPETWVTIGGVVTALVAVVPTFKAGNKALIIKELIQIIIPVVENIAKYNRHSTTVEKKEIALKVLEEKIPSKMKNKINDEDKSGIIEMAYNLFVKPEIKK